MNLPRCDRCQGVERPIICYPGGVVRCAHHLIRQILDPEDLNK